MWLDRRNDRCMHYHDLDNQWMESLLKRHIYSRGIGKGINMRSLATLISTLCCLVVRVAQWRPGLAFNHCLPPWHMSMTGHAPRPVQSHFTRFVRLRAPQPSRKVLVSSLVVLMLAPLLLLFRPFGLQVIRLVRAELFDWIGYLWFVPALWIGCVQFVFNLQALHNIRSCFILCWWVGDGAKMSSTLLPRGLSVRKREREKEEVTQLLRGKLLLSSFMPHEWGYIGTWHGGYNPRKGYSAPLHTCASPTKSGQKLDPKSEKCILVGYSLE